MHAGLTPAPEIRGGENRLDPMSRCFLCLPDADHSPDDRGTGPVARHLAQRLGIDRHPVEARFASKCRRRLMGYVIGIERLLRNLSRIRSLSRFSSLIAPP